MERCLFCGKPIEKKGQYFVCNDCKTVSFYAETDSETNRRRISGYLDRVQSAVIKKQDYLHEIEQKYLNGLYLTDNEKMIVKNLTEFQSIRSELSVRILGEISRENRDIKELLYRLLSISDWLESFLEM